MMIKQRVYFGIILVSLILIGVSACGFQPRNFNTLPKALHTLYIQSDDPYGSLTTTLRQTLRTSGINVVDSPSVAAVTLKLSRPVRTDNSATVGPTTSTRVFALTYSVTFTLTDSQGKNLLKPQTLTTSRTLTMAANQLLQSNNQLSTLTKEMEREIVNQLYNHLRSERVAEALKK